MRPLGTRPVTIGDETSIPSPLLHGPWPVLGFRFGRFAYCTDCNHIPEASLALLQGLAVLTPDALRRTPHPARFSLEEAIAMADRLGARQTHFTHMPPPLRHKTTYPDRLTGRPLASHSPTPAWRAPRHWRGSSWKLNGRCAPSLF